MKFWNKQRKMALLVLGIIFALVNLAMIGNIGQRRSEQKWITDNYQYFTVESWLLHLPFLSLIFLFMIWVSGIENPKEERKR